MTVRGYDLGNIIGPVQYCLVGFHVGRYFRPVGRETLSQGRGWCESFPRNEVVVF